MGVLGKRPPRRQSDRFIEPPLITNVEDILKEAEKDGKYLDGRGNLKLDEIAKEKGIELVYEDLPPTESGYFVKSGDNYRIGVNSKHSRTRQRFTLAHELGHYFLHHDKNDDVNLRDEIFYRIENTSSIEFAANEFAARLLMPEKRVEDKIKAGMCSLKDLADYFEVSPEAMRYRVVSLGYKVESDG